MPQRDDSTDSTTLINDAQWAVLKPILFRVRNTQGPSKRQCDREFLNAVIWLIKTNSAWRDLPPEFGDWHAVYVRFRRWEESRTWAQIRKELDDRALKMLNDLLKNEKETNESEDENHKRKYMNVKSRLINAMNMPVW